MSKGCISKRDWKILDPKYKKSFNGQYFVMMLKNSNNAKGYIEKWVKVQIEKNGG